MSATVNNEEYRRNLETMFRHDNLRNFIARMHLVSEILYQAERANEVYQFDVARQKIKEARAVHVGEVAA